MKWRIDQRDILKTTYLKLHSQNWHSSQVGLISLAMTASIFSFFAFKSFFS